ncbi:MULTISPECIES: TetR/AcrR family transcriptional regulator [Brochothrix]|uniref:TetR/AcrR family transcriptional regulator n=1 Tax=Brochothrix thermosphacta TaxID=2756 RepID=A0A1D2K1L3_BROTH|nr:MULTISPECIES: TetR/AcrR family transcriptional regulator [Brochothrix]ANZ98360.1 transcriptional regulator [Brochothrix thermosphacta]ATF25557.1 TetR/AcrR family transcriptional regulator [Brochothrix thermosphacta]ATH84890.1 TetR/AcrR family transcriptional regulator [Brochothrix thermosphacta]MBR5526351.1 TetR/AcrR family transcriptional regulator [Brochothrix sp.]MDO7863707.1 TetR/AcrR family transcriptional regulator [Brochothrix thermosphacta]
MARKRAFDKDKALDFAMEIFWEKGYATTSISDLTEVMGIQRPSLYSAFGDKEELFESALRRYNNQHASFIRKKLQTYTSVKVAFLNLFEGVIEEEYSRDTSKGCFCINTIVELAPHDEKFEVLTREHQMYLTVIFQEKLLMGVESGEIDKDIDVKAVAHSLVVTLVGITVLLKSGINRLLIDNAVNLTLSLIK